MCVYRYRGWQVCLARPLGEDATLAPQQVHPVDRRCPWMSAPARRADNDGRVYVGPGSDRLQHAESTSLDFAAADAEAWEVAKTDNDGPAVLPECRSKLLTRGAAVWQWSSVNRGGPASILCRPCNGKVYDERSPQPPFSLGPPRAARRGAARPPGWNRRGRPVLGRHDDRLCRTRRLVRRLCRGRRVRSGKR